MDPGGLAPYKSVAAGLNAWVCFVDEAGIALRPAKARTWGRRGRTPVVTVTAKGSGRVHLAGLVATRPGRRTRLIFRAILTRDGSVRPKGFRHDDLVRMLTAAHQQLRGPIVLVWDNATQHIEAKMRHWAARQPWLTMFRLPPYAPELNPVEQVWSHLNRGMANLAPHTIDEIASIAKTRLRRLQYRTDGILDHFIAHTALDMTGLDPP
ncbi:MAG TPA: transposase [Arthrobacter sp.]